MSVWQLETSADPPQRYSRKKTQTDQTKLYDNYRTSLPCAWHILIDPSSPLHCFQFPRRSRYFTFDDCIPNFVFIQEFNASYLQLDYLGFFSVKETVYVKKDVRKWKIYTGTSRNWTFSFVCLSMWFARKYFKHNTLPSLVLCKVLFSSLNSGFVLFSPTEGIYFTAVSVLFIFIGKLYRFDASCRLRNC